MTDQDDTSRRLLRKLEQENQELRAAADQVHDFLALMAHDLRDRLAPLISAAQVLRMADDPAAIRKAGEVIERRVRLTATAINELMDTSRALRGQVALELAPHPASHVVEAGLQSARPLLEERGHRLETCVHEPPPVVLGDIKQLGQVLAVLLDNAARFSESHGHIRVEVQHEGDQVVFAITDNGQGMTQAQLARLFRLTAAPPNEAANRGLGLGLVRAHRLAQLQGGSLQAHSDGPGQGSRFELRLPAAG